MIAAAANMRMSGQYEEVVRNYLDQAVCNVDFPAFRRNVGPNISKVRLGIRSATSVAALDDSPGGRVQAD
jgi:hypothetical protein